MASRPQETIPPSVIDIGRDGRRGLLGLAQVAIEDLSRLVQQEIRLAKLELKELLVRNAVAAGLLLGSGITLFVAAILGLVTLGLAFRPHEVLAVGLEAGFFLLVTIILAVVGVKRLKIGPPEKTMTSLREDAEWARTLLKRNGK